MRPSNYCNESKDSIANALITSGEFSIRSGTTNNSFHGNLQLPENMLFFSVKGSFKFGHGKAMYEIKTDQIAFLKKEICITYHVCEDEASFLVFPLKPCVILEFARLSNPRINLEERNKSIVITHIDRAVLPCLLSLQSYFSETTWIPHHLSKVKLLELLFTLSSTASPVMDCILDMRETFRPNIAHIVEENIENSISISQLARLSGRSVSSFRRDFLSIYNMAPSRWIRDKRLLKARDMLAGTTMTVTSICYNLGFESVAHFSRIFKARFGYPPSVERTLRNTDSGGATK